MQRVFELIGDAITRPPIELSTELICELHGLAMHGLIDDAGRLRADDVRIVGSRHEPPATADVPRLVHDLCAYINSAAGDAVHHAAYVLWRLNWIHPFAPDGNGRTARAVALLVLYARLGALPGVPPGKPTFFEYLSRKRLDYNDALEAADAACLAGRIDVSMLEALIVQAIEASTEPGGQPE